MKIINVLVLLCCFSGLSAQAQESLELQSVKRTRYAITAKYDSLADSKTVQLIETYKAQMNKQMNEVIGFAPTELIGGIPESPLLNLTADVLREAGTKFSATRVDIGLMNNGGLRNTIRSGNVTVGNIFEVYPFDNQLVVLKVKGKDLRELFAFAAKAGGGGVSGVTLKIKEGVVAELYVGAAELNEQRIYTVATIDYLADGNDGMTPLKRAIDRKNTGLLLREVMMDYIRNASKADKQIVAELDGRISIIK
jgi:2',3'-cyclic-nucleotide 2'-phosphodiesterase (5'-nucleotidase family)